MIIKDPMITSYSKRVVTLGLLGEKVIFGIKEL